MTGKNVNKTSSGESSLTGIGQREIKDNEVETWNIWKIPYVSSFFFLKAKLPLPFVNGKLRKQESIFSSFREQSVKSLSEFSQKLFRSQSKVLLVLRGEATKQDKVYLLFLFCILSIFSSAHFGRTLESTLSVRMMMDL